MEKVLRDGKESFMEFECSGLGVCEKPSLLLHSMLPFSQKDLINRGYPSTLRKFMDVSLMGSGYPETPLLLEELLGTVCEMSD